jgi:hypothetical protein
MVVTELGVPIADVLVEGGSVLKHLAHVCD